MLRDESDTIRPGAVVIPGDPSFFETTVCGTSIMLRTVCALGRVTDTVHVLKTPGWSEALAQAVEDEIDGRETRPQLAWTDSPDKIPIDSGLFVVRHPGVFDYRLCSAIEAAAQTDDQIIRCRRPGDDHAPLWFVGRDSARQLVEHFASGAGEPLGADFTSFGAVQDFNPDRSVCEIISDEQSRKAAETKLLEGARKDSDSFVARYFDRKVSSLITRWVVRVPVTPNQLTVMNTGLGLIGAALLLLGTYWPQLIGSALLVLSIILDGCDGEVARIKFMESTFGRKLDFFLDNVVNAFAIFAVGAGHYLQQGDKFYLYAPLVNAATALASVPPVYFLLFREKAQATNAKSLKSLDVYNLTEGIAGRDFVYLFFFLALFGRAYWFTYLGFGLLVFLPLVLVLLAVRWFRTRTASSLG